MSKVFYKALPKQALFHYSTADETLLGGAAGGGKSMAIIWDSVIFAQKFNDVRVSIFRRKYPELEKSIILDFLKFIPNKWYTYNKKEHRVYFKNGSIIEFNHCQYDQDVYNYQSAQYDRIYFDELTHFDFFIYSYLLSRLRTTKKGFKPQVKCATNPGNVGHFWVKARFVDGAEPFKVKDREVEGVKFTTMYIPSKVYDNIYLMENDAAYIQRLERLPEADRAALLEGNWDAFKGQFFKEWNYSIHTIEPFKIPDDWTRIRAMDWGFHDPTAVLWIAFSPDKKAYVYRELTLTETVIEDVAKKMIELSKGENIDYTVADPSIWSRTQFEKGESIAQRFISNGITLVKADNNRIGGWNVIHSYLYHDKDTEPKLKVFQTCFNLIRTLPGLTFSEKNPEDIENKTLTDDHHADALRYGLMTKPILIEKYRKRNVPFFSIQGFLDRVRDRRAKQGYVGSF